MREFNSKLGKITRIGMRKMKTINVEISIFENWK